MNSLIVPRIHYRWTIFSFDSLSISRLHYEYTIFFFAKSILIHCLLRDLTLNSISFSRNHNDHNLLFAKSIRIHNLFRFITLNPLSFSQNHYKFTSSQIFYEFTIGFTNFFLNSLFFFVGSPRNHFFPRNH